MDASVLMIYDKDVNDTEYAEQLITELDYLIKKRELNIGLHSVEFDDACEDRFPYIESENIICMMYFPWKFRNRNIKNFRKRDGLYGGKLHQKKIDDVYKTVEENIKLLYEEEQGKNVFYINNAYSISVSRDKKKIKNILNENNIPTPVMYETTSTDEILEIIKENNIYIKPRVGGEGKGITYLTKNKCLTNIDWDIKYNKTPFVDTHINVFQDDKWDMHKIDKEFKLDFLEDILQRYVLIEKEVDYALVNNLKVDFRVYAVFKKPVFILPRTNKPQNILTNWSRGGNVETQDFLNNFSKDVIKNIKQTAAMAAEVIGANFIGLDLIPSKDFETIYVLEGQTDPGYTKQYNLPRSIANNIIKMIELDGL